MIKDTVRSHIWIAADLAYRAFIDVLIGVANLSQRVAGW